MGAAAPIAAVSSIASLGLSAFGTIEKGKATQAADEFKASQAEEAAKFGRLQAELTDTNFREKLNMTLGNIESVRAGAHVDPTSPTTAAIEDWQTQVSDRQRIASDVTLRSQADADTASAAYLRKAGDFAVSMSEIDAAAGVAGGISKFALTQQPKPSAD